MPGADNPSMCVCPLWKSVVRFLNLILSLMSKENVIHTEVGEKGVVEYIARTMCYSPRSPIQKSRLQ